MPHLFVYSPTQQSSAKREKADALALFQQELDRLRRRLCGILPQDEVSHFQQLSAPRREDLHPNPLHWLVRSHCKPSDSQSITCPVLKCNQSCARPACFRKLDLRRSCVKYDGDDGTWFSLLYALAGLASAAALAPPPLGLFTPYLLRETRRESLLELLGPAAPKASKVPRTM